MARNKYGGVNDMPVGWLANKENKRVYVLWFDMLRRCYDEEQRTIRARIEHGWMPERAVSIIPGQSVKLSEICGGAQ